MSKAQVPAIDATNTVSTATGGMSFSLPLATVKGLNGHDYPINLSYKAGILYEQQASPAGLGFSYNPGTITRKIIYVPDENQTNDYTEMDWPAGCNVDRDYLGRMELISLGIQYITSAISCIMTAGTGSTAIQVLIDFAIQAALEIVPAYLETKSINTNPTHYIAGSSKTPKYDCATGLGRGIFNGAENNDLPDIYFINTPYISGQFVWIGDNSTGQYVFISTGGSSCIGKQTNEIISIQDSQKGYNTFKIKLTSGIQLHFEIANLNNYSSQILITQRLEHADCLKGFEISQRKPVPTEWYLTKVTFPDYVKESNQEKGAWISFEYNVLKEKAFRLLAPQKMADRSDLTNTIPSLISEADPAYLTDVTLKKITTPLQWAEFIYKRRYDDVWFKLDDHMILGGSYNKLPTNVQCKHDKGNADGQGEPVERKALDEIKVFDKNGLLKSVKFTTDYELKPGNLHSIPTSISGGLLERFTENPGAGSLTLKSISIRDHNGNELYPVQFKYAKNWQAGFVIEYNTYPMWPTGHVDKPVDYWGYYNVSSQREDHLNPYSKESSAKNSDVWSLTEVLLPHGKSIEWEYESNRYTKANGQPITTMAEGARFGCGPRVKKVTLRAPFTKEKTINYFYINDETPSLFAENANNCSGEATVEPNPYLLAANKDPRMDIAKGGVYTPAHIIYNTVLVVHDFDEKNPSIATNGYTVYKTVTSSDHPNGGRFGDIDSSWMRGQTKSVSIYNKDKILLSKTETEYGYECAGDIVNYGGRGKITLQPKEISNLTTCGFVYQKKVTTYSGGITTTKELSYKNGDEPANKGYLYTIPVPKAYTTVLGKVSNPDVICEQTNKNYSCFENASGSTLNKITALKRRCNSLDFYIAEQYNIEDPKSAIWKKSYKEMYYFGMPYSPTEWPLVRFGGFNYITGYGGVEPDLLIQGYLGYASNAQRIFISILPDFLINSSNNVEFGTPIFYQFTMSNGSLNGDLLCSTVSDIDNNGKPDVFFVFGSKTNPNSLTLKAFMNIKADGSPTTIADGSFNTQLTGDFSNAYCSFVSHYVDKSLIISNYTAEGAKTKLTQYKVNGFSVVGTTIAAGNVEKVNTDLVTIEYGTLPFGCTFFTENYNHIITGCEKGDDVALSLVDYSYGREFVLDGTVKKVIEKNSRGAILKISESTPAYWKYEKMATDAHLLTSICKNIVYKEDKTRPLSASASVWKSNYTTNDNKQIVWSQLANYQWNTKLSGGIADETISEFNFLNPSLNNKLSWKLMDSITYVSEEFMPVEIATPGNKLDARVYSSIITGHNRSLPIANIANARFDECAVLTGDYDDKRNGSLYDKENDWEKCASVLSNQRKHFGMKSVHINLHKGSDEFGPSRSIKIYQDKEYIFSCWVYVVSGMFELNGDYRKLLNNSIPFQTSQRVYGFPSKATIGQTGKWEFISLRLTPSNVISANEWNDNWAVRVYAGGPGYDVEAYIDDIRFHPVNALVSTTYYDTLLHLPIMSVDANNQPGNSVEYDRYGRPVKIFKFNKANPALNVQLQEKSYNDNMYIMRIYNPKIGQRYAVTNSMNIKWNYWRSGVNLRFYLSTDGGTTWPPASQYFTTYNQVNAGDAEITWQIPASTPASTNCRIKIVDVADNSTSYFSDPFEIYNSEILEPTSGKQIAGSSDLIIKWVLVGVDKIDIIYLQNGVTVNTLENDLSVSNGLGTYIWSLPSDISYDQNAKIKIIGKNFMGVPLPGQTLISNAFTIEDRSNFLLKWLFHLNNF
jgi:hypothetical protein